MSQLTLGIDVGGTFTDLLMVDTTNNTFRTAKVPTTPDDQAIGFMAAVGALDIPLETVDAVVHGTTVATNAILERKGATCGLITTLGFRDTIELGRRTRPTPWGLWGNFEAIISRELRTEVPERIDADGNVVVPLDEDAVRTEIAKLIAGGAEALVIHFIHSYLNSAHEDRCAEIARELWPNEHITLGSRVLREVREFERGSTAAVNGYIQPVISRYMASLRDQLAAKSYPRDLLVMQGNGGMMSSSLAGDYAAHTVMSGPAAGAIAAAKAAALAGFSNVISCDMGGTSFDIAVVKDGVPAVTTEKDITYAVPVRIPMVDIHTIGAGGGSIAKIDKGGILQVGPESAGADPGPICYGRGGSEPTVTDANLLLGRLDPTALAGVTTAGDVEQVRAAIAEKIGQPLGLDAIEAAAAIISVANNGMANATRMISIEKGHDPREFVVFAFGGAGPLHASAIARELGVPHVLVPRFPGITSAMGCVLADVRHDFVQTLHRPLAEIFGTAADDVLQQQAQEGRDLIASEGVEVTAIEVTHEADLLFQGQSHVMRIPLESPGFEHERVLADFLDHYRVRFGIDLPEMVAVLATLRTTVIGRRPTVDLSFAASTVNTTIEDALTGTRKAYFDGEWLDTGIYRREQLPPGAKLAGPAIVEQYDTTILIEPGSVAEVDRFGNLVIPVSPAETATAGSRRDKEIDPVTLAVIHSGLQQVASEMDMVHQKTSFSPIISEAFDRSNGIYDKDNGEIVAQGELGLPIFLGVMQSTTQSVIQHRQDIEQGDVIMVNDPYFGGTHLMDVKLVKPFYYKGKLWSYLSNTGHWPDTGGSVPGGFNSAATEIQQEGLRLPPVKLYSRGELNQDIVDIVLHNIRVPDERVGDIRAQVGAITVGDRRLTALLDKYGEETVSAVIAELNQRSERLMRAHIESIPDGTYDFHSFIDSDGVDPGLLRVELEMRVEGSDIYFDLSKSSPACRGPLNSVWATTQASVYCGIKHIFPDVPINSGCFKPLHLDKPRGTFLYAEYPRPVAGCAAETAQRIMEVVFGAMSKAIPDRVFAAPAGTSGNFSLGGVDPALNRAYVMYIFSGGGYGGYEGSDGLTNGTSPVGISKTQPAEILEQHYPVLFEEYALREGSAGAGRFRGGFGVDYRVRLLRGDGKASFMMDHGRTGPHGLLGGSEGATNVIEIRRNGEVIRPEHESKGEGFELKAGDTVQVRTPGGGGYGDPKERDAALIERDQRRGYFGPSSGTT